MSELEAPFRLPDAPVAADLVANDFRRLGEPTRLRIPEPDSTAAKSAPTGPRATRRIYVPTPSVPQLFDPNRSKTLSLDLESATRSVQR
jgi:hypothetical protein